MTRVLLINPNSSAATTAMMVGIAQLAAGGRAVVTGATASRAPPMIVDAAALDAAAGEVVEIALANQDAYDAMIVAAFGDPGLATIRARLRVPVAGIAEAAMHAAAAIGRFGVATTTPGLAAAIGARAAELGLAERYTGIRLTTGDPASLLRDPARLEAALAGAIAACIERDGADAVIIGGGPLAEAARALRPRFATPIVAPIQAAIERILAPRQPGSP